MAKIYKRENGEKTPCIIVSKPNTMDPIPYSANSTSAQRYIMNEVVKRDSTDADIILPFVYRDTAGSAYSYKWQYGTMDVYLGSQINWVNKKEMFTYFNDNHAWSSFMPTPTAGSAWKAEIHENNETENALCSVAVNDTSIGNYSIFIENYRNSANNTWSAIKPINQKSNLDYSVSTSASSDQKLLASQVDVSSQNNFNINVGFGMIISGNGLDNYINKVNDNNTPLPCSLFALRVKGGMSDYDAYTATNYNNSITKFYSFNKKLINENTKLNDFSYKKLNNNVYYLYDKSFIKLNNSNIESKSIKFTQPYIYTQNSENSQFSIQPKNGTYYHLYATFNKNNISTSYFYAGDTVNYEEKWISTTSVNYTRFAETSDCKFNIPTTSTSMGNLISSGFQSHLDYLRINYDFNNGLTGFMGMPQTHIMALSYYFTKLN
jgi:hypothetical protein